MLKEVRRFFWLNFLEFSLLSFVFASETEASQAGSAWLDFAGKTINFLVLFGSLGYFLYHPLKQWLRNKSLSVARIIEETIQARKEAESKLSSIQERLIKIDQEIEEMRRKAEVEGLKEKKRILLLAKEEAARIEKLTTLEIEALRQGALRELKAYAASLATALAETRIRQKLTPELHRRLIRRSIERLTKLDESPSAG